MLPINQFENSRRMLQTNEYQHKTGRFMEEVWLYSYLHQYGKSDQEIYDIWIKFFPRRSKLSAICDNPEKEFGKVKKTAYSHKAKEGADLIVTEAELNYINNMFCPKWVREYAMLYLLLLRAYNKTRLEHMSGKDLLRLVKRHRNANGQADALDILCREGFLRVETETLAARNCPIIDENGFLIGYEPEGIMTTTYIALNVDTPRNDKVVLQLKTIDDYQVALDMINMQFECAKCGAFFEITANAKSHLCPQCKQDARREDMKRNSERFLQGHPDYYKIRTCTKILPEKEK